MAHHEYDDILEALRQLKPQLQRQYPAISYLGLFGSYVRDEQQVDSDVDILIDFDFSIGKISLFDYSDIAHFLSEHLGKKVDLAHKSELRPRIGQHILSEVKEVI